MKIAIIGAGAIGSSIGGLLARAGEDVTLIGRKSHIHAINKNGLFIDGVFGNIKVKIKAKEHLDFNPDLLLLAVKTQDVAAAAKEIKLYVSGVPIVTMQNGVRSDSLVSEVLGKENIMSSVVLFGGTFLEPGKITISNYSPKGSLLIGKAFGANDKNTENIASVLNKAIPTVITNDVHSAHWTKLIANLNNVIPAVTGLSMQETMNYPQLRLLSILLMKEGLRVVESANIKPASLPGIPISIIKIMLGIPPQIGSQFLGFMSKFLGNIPIYGSTLQSIKRGKSTEIDYLNGEIIALGKKSGMLTSYNSGIVNLVHQVEATGRFIEAEKVLSGIKNQNYE